jgi:enoyl-CoA hydratase
MTDAPEVLVERRGHALWITLNRPQALNALNHPMAVTIHRAVIDAMGDHEVQHIVIDGAGERAFRRWTHAAAAESRRTGSAAERCPGYSPVPGH